MARRPRLTLPLELREVSKLKKKSFFAPSQMIILTSGGNFDDQTTSGGIAAKPSPFIDDVGEDIIIGTDDGTGFEENGDMNIAPEVSGGFAADADEAYK